MWSGWEKRDSLKRLWFGVGLLTVILVLGILLSGVMERSNKECSALLHRAADSALEENWETAGNFLETAKEKWQKNWAVIAALADHQPMDEIDALFAELETYALSRDAVNFGGTGTHLASLLDAMSRSHKFTLWNFLSCPLPESKFLLPGLPPQ